jgi:dTDP-glucose 4,6-dehydratase
MQLKAMKRLIKDYYEKNFLTGAAGFLGSHLCDRFIAEGCHVIGMDNLITGDLNNISHLFPLENFEFHHRDVSTICTFRRQA